MGPEMVMLSMGLNILGGVTKAAGSIFGGASKSSMYEYQAGMARMNAEIARDNAKYARSTGEYESRRMGQKGAFQRGSIISAQSGRGVIVGQGSAGQVVESQQSLNQQDQMLLRKNAARRAYGHEVEATNKEAEASMYQASASNARMASYIEAGGSILGSASSVAGKWYEASQYGMFDSYEA